MVSDSGVSLVLNFSAFFVVATRRYEVEPEANFSETKIQNCRPNSLRNFVFFGPRFKRAPMKNWPLGHNYFGLIKVAVGGLNGSFFQ